MPGAVARTRHRVGKAYTSAVAVQPCPYRNTRQQGQQIEQGGTVEYQGRAISPAPNLPYQTQVRSDVLEECIREVDKAVDARVIRYSRLGPLSNRHIDLR